jgi:3-methyladenine DNA glycosylase AlkD
VEAAERILAELRGQGSAANVAGMARYGISAEGTLGVPVPVLRAIAKREGRDHELAGALWESGIHEARMLAGFIDVPAEVTGEQMERWVAGFDSWDVCDQVCGNLFDRTPYAWDKATEWARRDETFVKRAAFALMTQLAVHDKKAPSERFDAYLPLIAEAAGDDRNFVKKAVNWALRQIGKRDARLNAKCTELAEELASRDDKTARWIGKDALRELTSDAVRERLAKHG